MQKDSCGRAGNRGSGVPAQALDQLRRGQDASDRERRWRMQSAALEAAGEVGYPRLAVRHVLVRSGETRSRFYSHFESKADCFASAYEVAAERLCNRLLDVAAAQGSWRAGLRSALAELALFLSEQPLLAMGMLTQVHLAGEPVTVKRKEVFERLSHAIDRARRETGSRHSPPPIAAEFILSAIEETAVSTLARRVPNDFARIVPELSYLTVAVYFGKSAAQEELTDQRD